MSGVAINKVNIKSVGSTADTVPANWTLAKDSSDNVIATVETDGLSVSDPSGLEPGETKVLIKAADGATNYFNGVAVNGSHAWKVDGSTINSDLDIGGVAITGTQTKGGVKVNEANTNQIIYEESKKKINTLTLGKVTFKNDDGTASTVARSFDKTYDVSTATINDYLCRYAHGQAGAGCGANKTDLHRWRQKRKHCNAERHSQLERRRLVSDPLTGTTKSMTLLKGVTGVVATKVSGTPSFTVVLDQTNTKLDAKATGSAGVSNSDVTYTVSGVAINKVNLKSVGSMADTVPDNWTLANGATVETDDLVVASPSGLEPGETKVLIKAADGATNYFNGVSVNGNYAWKVDNSTITSDRHADQRRCES